MGLCYILFKFEQTVTTSSDGETTLQISHEESRKPQVFTYQLRLNRTVSFK